MKSGTRGEEKFWCPEWSNKTPWIHTHDDYSRPPRLANSRVRITSRPSPEALRGVVNGTPLEGRGPATALYSPTHELKIQEPRALNAIHPTPHDNHLEAQA